MVKAIKSLRKLNETWVGTQTAYGYLADSTRYEVCRTLQYGLRPAINTSILIVTPQSSTWLGAQKTPEEVEEEAKNKGWLQVWNEFSWLPPWYWLHAKATIGTATIHIALSPLMPFWPGTVEFTGLDKLLPQLPSTPQPPSPPPPPPEETSTILKGMVTTVMRNLLVLAVTAVASAYAPLPATILAMGIYVGGSAWLIADAVNTYYSSEWGAHTKAHTKLASLMVTFACAAIAVEMSFSAGTVFKIVVTSVLSAFLASLINPSALETALQSSCFSICIGLFAALAALKIPNPMFSNVYFRPTFLAINLIFFATTMATIVGLPL